MPSLLVVSGPSEGKYFPLRGRRVVVGRSEECDIQIVDDMISGHHLELHYDEAESSYHARDMRSTNGVVINDQPVTGDTRLIDGDRIEIGVSTLRYSTHEFPDLESALMYFKLPGESDRSTMIG